MGPATANVHPVEERLESVREHELTATREVAEAVGATRKGTHYRLRQLESAGLLWAKKVGRELLWMVPVSQ